MLEILATAFSRCSELAGVQWAPVNVPISRRLQTVGATAWICFVLFGELFSILLFLKLVYSYLWWLAIVYTIWMLNDLDTSNRGSRIFEWTRNWAWWRYYRDYFPIKLVKTKDLDPSRNYLLACFPHGVVCSGIFGAFATNALDCYKIFPGLTFHLITLGGHFLVPLFRELILSLGMCSSSQDSLSFLLDKRRNSGKCAVLLVGGAAEALDSHPGEYKVILKRRKGFIRVAMKSGSPIVPVFSFGEPDVFRPLNNPEDGWLRWAQERVRARTGISPMFPIGRGIFQYSYGVVPLRSPITIVAYAPVSSVDSQDLEEFWDSVREILDLAEGNERVIMCGDLSFGFEETGFEAVLGPYGDKRVNDAVGEPMEVTKNLEPSDEEVDVVHGEFTKRLVDLFEREKSKYLKNHQNLQLIVT